MSYPLVRVHRAGQRASRTGEQSGCVPERLRTSCSEIMSIWSAEERWEMMNLNISTHLFTSLYDAPIYNRFSCNLLVVFVVGKCRPQALHVQGFNPERTLSVGKKKGWW